ncbi:phosphatases II [Melanogaster broomeanus]|nr:phosphatases II [Melanogaster broomeanus]
MQSTNNQLQQPQAVQKLSINLPSAQSSTTSLLSPLSDPQSVLDPPKLDMFHTARPRRPSVLSLPNTSITTALHRKDEDGSPTVPYLDGPIQILPDIWLGSEDNARDWPGLLERRIKAILNVAKELEWSHGQRDLVTTGFPTAMAFVDAALDRKEGVLIHCQCGVSRSATLMIAIVMRAAAMRLPNVPPYVWELKGMQAAYAFVKEKSKHVGPNMSLIYQLLDYEKALQGGGSSSVASDQNSSASEEEKEWGHRRNAFVDEDDAIQQEAKDLDRAMEERTIARKLSASSVSSGVGMGPAWRNKYGRKRSGSIASIHTTASVLSEDLVEADEESELLGIGAGFDDALEPRRSPSLSSGSPSSPSETTSQATVTAIPLVPRPAFPRRNISSLPSAPATKLCFSTSRLPPTKLTLTSAAGKVKRRPPTLPPVPSSPITPISQPDNRPSPRRRRHLSRRQAPPPLKLQGDTNSPFLRHLHRPSSSFHPLLELRLRTAMRTPATVTVTSNMKNNSYPFPSQTTPHVATSRSQGRTRSFIGLGNSVAPTTAYSRVDARGWVGLE